MALDIYVMPLWKFKVGDFASPLERLFGSKVKTITLSGVLDRAKNAPAQWRARREVAAIRKAVGSANGTTIDWKDEGDVVYSEQSGGMQALQAYARWLDVRHRYPEFTEPPENDYRKHPVMELDYDRDWSFPHMVKHDCYSGYYLPCDFSTLVSVEPHQVYSWTFERTVGSSIRLRDELAEIGKELKISDDWNYVASDPLYHVKCAHMQLNEVSKRSCEHELPIIFWG
jgi:hypothetical protein